MEAIRHNVTEVIRTLTPEQRRARIDRTLRQADELAGRLADAILDARAQLRGRGIEEAAGRVAIAADLAGALATTLREQDGRKPAEGDERV